jgi:hypothetical protein
MRKNQSQMVNQINDLKSLLEAQKLKKKQAKKDSKKIFDLVLSTTIHSLVWFIKNHY